MNEPAAIEDQLSLKKIAVLGLSDRPERPSYYVSRYMQGCGYDIYPVNPAVPAVLGKSSHASLTALVEQGIRPELVNVFRASSFLPAIVDEMLTLGLRSLWVQQGIVDLHTATRAEDAGIKVVMDRCLMIEHRQRTNSAQSVHFSASPYNR